MEKIFVGQITQKAILKYKNSFILVKEKTHPKWILPGGRLNLDETAEEGLIREVKEELKVDCVIEKLLSVHAYQGGDEKSPKLFVFYLASVSPGEEIIIDSEITNSVLVSTKKDLENYPMNENQRKVLVEFLD